MWQKEKVFQEVVMAWPKGKRREILLLAQEVKLTLFQVMEVILLVGRGFGFFLEEFARARQLRTFWVGISRA